MQQRARTPVSQKSEVTTVIELSRLTWNSCYHGRKLWVSATKL